MFMMSPLQISTRLYCFCYVFFDCIVLSVLKINKSYIEECIRSVSVTTCEIGIPFAVCTKYVSLY